MAVKKITRRWLFNSFGVIVFIIVLVEAAAAYSVYNYYYSTARQALAMRADVATGDLERFLSNSTAADFAVHVGEYVASFPEKARMELMTVDSDGKIALTSSGFTPDDQSLPDYAAALKAGSSGEFVGELDTGGRVMAITALFTAQGEHSLSAVRLVTSLTEVDRQIAMLVAAALLLGVGVLILILFSSSYFINSIVNPVTQVGETARRIAGGDFNARLQKKTNDEIGELCDIINYMASELDAAEKLKNDFISSVSHELRTPLTAIRGWGETLLSDGGEDKAMLERGMNVIISETGRLSSMVEELLDFSRMQSGRLKLVLGKMDVMAELSEAALMYTQRASREGLSLIFEEDGAVVPVYGDKNKLRQVFVNVIDNAVKYSDSGDTVTITTALAQQYVIITVRDTGIGIKPEDLPQVKAKFFKAESTRRGAGIGLAVADEIITRHGGTLDIDSEYGAGTKVTITLPVYQKQDGMAQIDDANG